MSALNFAPYSEPPPSPPSHTRWQPPPASGSSSYQSGAPISSLGPATSFSSSSQGFGASSGGTTYWNGGPASGYEVKYRLDVEAVLAYALGVFGAVALLIFETESDYVRYHAYQSGLLCVGLAVLHVVFLLFGWVLEGLLFGFDVILLGFLALRAYRDTETLERYKLPYIGLLAERWVEEE